MLKPLLILALVSSLRHARPFTFPSASTTRPNRPFLLLLKSNAASTVDSISLQVALAIKGSPSTQSSITNDILNSLTYLSPSDEEQPYLLLLLSVLERAPLQQISTKYSALSSAPSAPSFRRSFKVIEEAIDEYDSSLGVGGEPWLEGGGKTNEENAKMKSWEEYKWEKEFGNNANIDGGNDDGGNDDGGNDDGGNDDKNPTNGTPANYYEILSIPRTATTSEIKSAFRSLAKTLHPDTPTSSEADPTGALFKKIAEAYSVLSDPPLRKTYDLYGVSGDRANLDSRVREVEDSIWGELKNEFSKTRKQPNRRDVARQKSAAQASTNDENQEEYIWEGSDAVPQHLTLPSIPQVGNVVKYPLSPVARSELTTDRSHGLGLLVGRNIDRGDVKNLMIMNPEQIELTEVTPLVCVCSREDEESGKEIHIFEKDELGSTCFPRLSEMEKCVEIVDFHKGFDRWTLRGVEGVDLKLYSDELEEDEWCVV